MAIPMSHLTLSLRSLAVAVTSNLAPFQPHIQPRQLKAPLRSAASSSALSGKPLRGQTLSQSYLRTAVSSVPVRSMASDTKDKLVEHLVFFKLKPGNEEGAATMVTALQALETLPGVLHLIVGESISSGDWTHALYGRYASKDALTAYAVSPEHMAVVKDNVRPIAEEIIAIDWEIEEGGVDAGASVIRAYMLEVSEEDARAHLGEGFQAAKKVEDALSGVVRWITTGKNFATARASGHTWGLLAAFDDEEKLRKFAASVEQKALLEDGILGSSKKANTIDFKAQSKM